MTKEEEGVDVISSKKGIQICIREKHATHAYTNLSLVLIITSQNYISHQKILMKSAATVLSGKCPRVVNLRLYSLDKAQAYQFRYFVSSCILNNDCISKKSKNVYQVPTSSARKKLWTMKCGAPKRFLMLSLKIILSWKKWY